MAHTPHKYKHDYYTYLNQIILNVQMVRDRGDMTWDKRMAIMQELTKLVPYVLRYMIFFKNVEGEKKQ